MIHSTGPLPPGVYWRRRVAAVSVSVAAVVLLAWIIGRLVGGEDEAQLHGLSARPSKPPSSRPAAGRPASTSATSGTAAPVAAPAAPPPPSPVAAPPQPCPDTAVQVLAETGEPSYPVGGRPLLRLVIVNAGPLACVRDVSRSTRELMITSADGATRLWSSTDCYSPPGADSRLLSPGERLTFTVNWAGRTSEPGCPTQRRTVPPGSYLLTPRLGPIVGAPMPLRLEG